MSLVGSKMGRRSCRGVLLIDGMEWEWLMGGWGREGEWEEGRGEEERGNG